jgi:hypothetical protein
MSENTFEAIDVSDFADYCCGVHVRWIKHAQTGGSVILVSFLTLSLVAKWGVPFPRTAQQVS